MLVNRECDHVNKVHLMFTFWFQLEKSLKTQIDGWEEEHGKEFLVNGQKFLEYVQQQWEQHHAEKENEKLERVCFYLDKTIYIFWSFHFLSQKYCKYLLSPLANEEN